MKRWLITISPSDSCGGWIKHSCVTCIMWCINYIFLHIKSKSDIQPMLCFLHSLIVILGTPVQLLQIFNQPNTWQKLSTLKNVNMKTMSRKNGHQNGEERWSKWPWTWHGYWCQKSMNISEAADLLGDFLVSGRSLVHDVRGQRIMPRFQRAT